MKENFNACLALTLEHEGGYVDHPRDPGGPTNMGITIATLSRALGRAATVDDVRGLTREKAAAIYRETYWNSIDGDDLPAGVDAVLFDISVNSGPVRALRWRDACRDLPPEARIRALDARRRSFWRALSTFRVFGRGWMAREDAVLSTALRMASASPGPASTPADARSPDSRRLEPARISSMKGYRTYVAAAIVAAGGVVAQTDWLSFLANPRAGLVAIGSAALMAVMRSITTSAPGQAG